MRFYLLLYDDGLSPEYYGCDELSSCYDAESAYLNVRNWYSIENIKAIIPFKASLCNILHKVYVVYYTIIRPVLNTRTFIKKEFLINFFSP